MTFRSGYLNVDTQKKLSTGVYTTPDCKDQRMHPLTKKVLPFVSTYYSNYDNSNILTTTKNLIQNSKNKDIKQSFKDVRFINSYRQPPNLLRQLTNAEYITGIRNEIRGITLCGRLSCKICKLH